MVAQAHEVDHHGRHWRTGRIEQACAEEADIERHRMA
ncbi:hypothetical protein X741_17575 [Mesorhizobium sp. LNHC229A00]|nr:hypothetical protein X741_17575 [Mesorhizobium sp. LNHC229A00]